MQDNWYAHWFGEDYKALYPHRDDQQADDQVNALIAASSAQPRWRILDVGCGSGRHLRAFRSRKFGFVHGVDLSFTLLKDRLPDELAVARADMRRLPFADGAFDMLACFFTSFGYFATWEEDVAVLVEFCRVVKPEGFLFLDLHNPEHVTRNLVPTERCQAGEFEVEVERSIANGQVVKRIRLRGAGGERQYEERVRLFSLAMLEPVIKRLGLSLLRVFGDERGSVFTPDSPRMGLLLGRG